MKKIIWVVGIVMLFASTVFAGAITKADLANLKGTWEGNASIGVATASMKLEILNNTIPLEGKATISNVDRFKGQDFSWTGEYYTAQSSNGMLTNKGTIMFVGEGGKVFEIRSLGKDKSGKPILEGWFYGQGGKVDWKVTKK